MSVVRVCCGAFYCHGGPNGSLSCASMFDRISLDISMRHVLDDLIHTGRVAELSTHFIDLHTYIFTHMKIRSTQCPQLIVLAAGGFQLPTANVRARQ